VDRKTQQADLVFQAGQLLKPVFDVIREPHKYDRQERARVRAKYQAERDLYANSILSFTRVDPALCTTRSTTIVTTRSSACLT